MTEKAWVNLNDFKAALEAAIEMVAKGEL